MLFLPSISWVKWFYGQLILFTDFLNNFQFFFIKITNFYEKNLRKPGRKTNPFCSKRFEIFLPFFLLLLRFFFNNWEAFFHNWQLHRLHFTQRLSVFSHTSFVCFDWNSFSLNCWQKFDSSIRLPFNFVSHLYLYYLNLSQITNRIKSFYCHWMAKNWNWNWNWNFLESRGNSRRLDKIEGFCSWDSATTVPSILLHHDIQVSRGQFPKGGKFTFNYPLINPYKF